MGAGITNRCRTPLTQTSVPIGKTLKNKLAKNCLLFKKQGLDQIFPLVL